jgi:hypothetical protein
LGRGWNNRIIDSAQALFILTHIRRRVVIALRKVSTATLYDLLGLGVGLVFLSACGGGGGAASPPSAPEPNVSFSTTILTFPQIDWGSASSPQSVTLSNTGNAPLSISSIAITGANPGDFAQTNTCGNSVVAGGKWWRS